MRRGTETEWSRMTVDTLKDCNKRVLAQMAKQQGIVGWHSMRKDQLIRALSLPQKGASKNNGSKPAQAHSGSHAVGNGAPVKRHAPPSQRLLTVVPPRVLDHACTKDRIIAMVRDPFWLHVYLELSRATLARAQAALGQDWHTARPILRVMDVTSEDTTSASERHVR